LRTEAMLKKSKARKGTKAAKKGKLPPQTEVRETPTPGRTSPARYPSTRRNSLAASKSSETILATLETPIEPKIGIYDWVDLPPFQITNLASSGRFVHLSGPEETNEGGCFECWDLYACGRCISNYPVKREEENRVIRMGDPIADYFLTRVYMNRAILALADGCGWGKSAKDAARIAANTFLSYLDSRHADMLSVRDIGRLILRAFSEAHEKILKSHDDIWEAGTTTMLAGMIVELNIEDDVNNSTKENGHSSTQNGDKKESPRAEEDEKQVSKAKDEKDKGKVQEKEKEKDKEKEKETQKEKEKGKGERCTKWVFVCASVGDCKALHYSKTKRKITDITHGNRIDVRSTSDPGGRLGAMVGDGAPDLRNLFVHFCPCDEGDMLMLLTDGVHDNFDPVTRGLTPSELGFPEGSSWATVNDAELLEQKSKWLQETAERLLASLPICDATGVPPAQSVAHAFVEMARQTCKNSLEWMETSSEPVPEDFKQYPGKMDHATCLVLHVGPHLAFSGHFS